jgi:hypothetical protein
MGTARSRKQFCDRRSIRIITHCYLPMRAGNVNIQIHACIDMDRIKALFLIVLLILTVLVCFSCLSSKQRGTNDTATDDPPDMKRSIPPGTAIVRCLVLDVEEKNDGIGYMVKIQNVLEYGPSTPFLPVDTELYINSGLTISDEMQKTLSTGEEVCIQIAYLRGSQGLGYWYLVEFVDTE